MGKRILITGATGLIGSQLTQLLLKNGYEVAHVSRSRKRKSTIPTYVWDVDNQTLEDGALENVEAIIHLAGANVGEKRWTDKRKREILDSRVKSTTLLYEKLRTTQHSVKSFISASAIGFYGFEGERIFSENDSPGSDFLATVTRQWEDAVDNIAALTLRVVKLRIGVVLAKGEGALDPIAKAVYFNVGAPLGTGQQWMSWIHIDDVCTAFLFAIENDELSGAYNLTAPEPVTNKRLTEEVARVLGKPMILPKVPSFALRLLFGQMADIIVKGSRVSCKKLVESGFQFRFTKVSSAIEHLLKR